MIYRDFFHSATGTGPYPYQEEFATAPQLAGCLEVPTGAGKTAAVILGWLWRRRVFPEQTPRRLVYCLPMRVLVEQTLHCAQEWVRKLGLTETVRIVPLMGGVTTEKWDVYPEQETVLVGTQDMLLSRALNRGYGMSRYRWPLHFGLLHNDALWVLDELQLLGPGLPTSVQLEAFRRRWSSFGPTHTLWMSATIRRDWLKTVDFDPNTLNASISLGEGDLRHPDLVRRLQARKAIRKARSTVGDSSSLADEIQSSHQPGSLTLVICNTIKRAVAIFDALTKKKLRLLLIHSRFRPPERRQAIEALEAADREAGQNGTIVVSTQVIEAGVDLKNARLLITELAPWASLVQRFGRCNRNGTVDDAEILWLDTGEKFNPRPYTAEELDAAREELAELKEAGPAHLPRVTQDFPSQPVLRSKDLLELFDTTPDLAGFDLDISRFIRDADDTDAQVFWRDLEWPADAEAQAERDELCSVPLGELRDFLKGKGRQGWVRDALNGQWVKADPSALYPGVVVLLPARQGGYSPARGWDPGSKAAVTPCQKAVVAAEDYDAERASGDWETLVAHTQAVVDQTHDLLKLLPIEFHEQMIEGARWHDAGKAHPAFQAKFSQAAPFPEPPAKAPPSGWKKGRLPKVYSVEDGRRRHFRHELASALVALQLGRSDLVAYLCACHHGKVRLSIRSFPDEHNPGEGIRFARGVWEGDLVPAVALGGGVSLPETTLDLSYLEMGEGPRGPSWLARVLQLLEWLGPFRLAYLEALIKCADERASAVPALAGVGGQQA